MREIKTQNIIEVKPAIDNEDEAHHQANESFVDVEEFYDANGGDKDQSDDDSLFRFPPRITPDITGEENCLNDFKLFTLNLIFRWREWRRSTDDWRTKWRQHLWNGRWSRWWRSGGRRCWRRCRRSLPRDRSSSWAGRWRIPWSSRRRRSRSRRARGRRGCPRRRRAARNASSKGFTFT